MRLFIKLGIFYTLTSAPFAQAQTARGFADGFVHHLVTEKQIVEGQCKTATLNANDERCGAPEDAPPLDFIYLPKALGDVILSYIRQAYARKYYAHMDKTDFFHGHVISRGPRNTYDSIESYFADVTMILFHSREYLQGAWQEIPADEDVRAPKTVNIPRSFVGYLNGGGSDILPAIDIISPTVRLMNSYAQAGTIFTDEVVDSLPGLTQHVYHPSEADSYIKTCLDGNCEPCALDTQLYLLQDDNGRFVSPDGVRLEMFFRCEYAQDL